MEILWEHKVRSFFFLPKGIRKQKRTVRNLEKWELGVFQVSKVEKRALRRKKNMDKGKEIQEVREYLRTNKSLKL